MTPFAWPSISKHNNPWPLNYRSIFFFCSNPHFCILQCLPVLFCFVFLMELMRKPYFRACCAAFPVTSKMCISLAFGASAQYSIDSPIISQSCSAHRLYYWLLTRSSPPVWHLTLTPGASRGGERERGREDEAERGRVGRRGGGVEPSWESVSTLMSWYTAGFWIAKPVTCRWQLNVKTFGFLFWSVAESHKSCDKFRSVKELCSLLSDVSFLPASGRQHGSERNDLHLFVTVKGAAILF